MTRSDKKREEARLIVVLYSFESNLLIPFIKSSIIWIPYRKIFPNHPDYSDMTTEWFIGFWKYLKIDKILVIWNR